MELADKIHSGKKFILAYCFLMILEDILYEMKPVGF